MAYCYARISCYGDSLYHDIKITMKFSKSTSDTQPLLGLPAPQPQVRQTRFPKKFLFLPSKGALLILLWTMVVGMVYKTITAGSAIAVDTFLNQGRTSSENVFETSTVFVLHTLLILVPVFYPIAGFIADIYVGRYRVVMFSVLLILCGCVSFSVGSVLYFSGVIQSHQTRVTRGLKDFAAVLIIGYVLTFIGFSGYQSNYIQLGLDQLQDAPSYSSGLFVHSVGWFMIIGMMLLQFIFSWCMCSYDLRVIDFLISLPFLFVLLLLLLVFIGWWRSRWFHAEPARHNPYRTVFQAIKFAWKHRYPVQYSTLIDDEQPTRLDYAKEGYGGPFTNEQVEDVKTFLKVIMVLLSLGPVFVLAVPAGLFFVKFAQHVTQVDRTVDSCNWKWIVLDTGGVKYVVASLFFPLYMWFLYSVLRSCIPRIFTRLWVWIFAFVACIGSMVLIDLLGHILYYHQKHVGMACILTHTLDSNEDSTLNLPWVVLVLPCMLLVVAPMMVITTTFEFITAQSPYAMNGLLVGVFFAIMGVSEFIGSLIFLPFFLPHYWSKEEPVPIVNCGFGYLLSLCAIGAMGLVLFSMAAKVYKYRKR